MQTLVLYPWEYRGTPRPATLVAAPGLAVIGLVAETGHAVTQGLIWPRLECQAMKAVIRIETSSPGSSTPSLAT